MEVPVVSFIVNRLGVLLTEEAKFLYGVSDQVEQIRVELKRMQCFLQDADYAIQSDHHVDARVNNWVAEIRKLAYETEDILEIFVIQVSSKRNKKGFRNTLKRFACIFSEGQDAHRVGCEIGAIKNNITDLTASLHTYGLKSTGEGIRSSVVKKQQELRQSYQHVVNEDFVGFEEDLNKVVKHLVQVHDYTSSRVVSVCGMGGLGKTTLAKKVYHHKDVQSHFKGLAWVCISQQYQTRDILQEIFINLVPERKGDVVRMTNNELFEQLYEVQQSKKCLVVLDDIWSIEAWKSLEPAFPNGNTGSKILLTTRNKILPSQIDPYHIVHEPQCLNDKESWDLLQKKSLLRRDGRGASQVDFPERAQALSILKDKQQQQKKRKLVLGPEEEEVPEKTPLKRKKKITVSIFYFNDDPTHQAVAKAVEREQSKELVVFQRYEKMRQQQILRNEAATADILQRETARRH